MMLFFFQFLIVFSWISASNCCSLWEHFVEVQSCIVNNFYRSSIFFFVDLIIEFLQPSIVLPMC